ncbi:helix-turn-helix transcriptional regulator [Cryobacterium sp. Hb1]|uniref:helix-turn-helix transcriptional regulator n=1 Tax=Cryobacterium sp. Hb1 TaxID=1259147 RepID=UPI001069A3B4|nr:helix-turn-helix transcriptional regulator [Cryobacterium sp. Hb1]TFD65587.1 XRE family transcriptional regulator [Cryobacterium sp. Hb1]
MSRTPRAANGLGTRIREARALLGWSQTVLSEKAGLSRPTIARVELGNDVSLVTLVRVAAALGMRIELKDGSERIDAQTALHYYIDTPQRRSSSPVGVAPESRTGTQIPSRIGDADMMRASVATTHTSPQALRAGSPVDDARRDPQPE